MVHPNTNLETAPHLDEEKTLILLIEETEEEMMQPVRTIEITINPEIIALLTTLVVKTQENIEKTDLIVQELDLKIAEIHMEITEMIAVEGPLKKPIEFEVASHRQNPHSEAIHQVGKKEKVLEIQVRK